MEKTRVDLCSEFSSLLNKLGTLAKKYNENTDCTVNIIASVMISDAQSGASFSEAGILLGTKNQIYIQNELSKTLDDAKNIEHDSLSELFVKLKKDSQAK